ncbi:sensor histidine kinase [Ruegeria sp. HKCCSP351]|uniref:sensor histidine kinase n=1 Tax=Ruegeria sp. HKCCSP351 TaxID=2794832 RepID=UPI001FD75482|nr:sensor histidine kinase [Ruegeria sp. HKCCSP351]
MIAVYQTNAVVNEAIRLSHASLLSRTQSAAARERELLQRAGGAAQGLAAAAPSVLEDAEACAEAMEEFVWTRQEYLFAAYISPTGWIECSSDHSNRDVSEDWHFLKVAELQDLSFALVASGPGYSGKNLMASAPVRKSGEVVGYVAVVTRHNLIDTVSGQRWAADGIQFTTVDNQGEILSSSVALDQATLALPVSIPRRELVGLTGSTFFEDARSGDERFFAVSEIISDQVVVVGSWPSEDAFSVEENAVSVVTLAFPVLMWASGIAVAVFGIQRLVIRHLNALRSAMRRYALGEREQATLELIHPPKEFEEARQSFNRMVAILSEAERRREMDLEEKTILLREVHHRVKNNLQLIASIMNMQARGAQTPEARRMLSQLQRRVRGLATIHRSLNTNPDITTVDSRDLIANLVNEIGSMSAGGGQTILIEKDLVSVALSQDQAVTLSMLVSEAMTNAMKYVGVPEGGRPEISVCLKEADDSHLILEMTNTKGQPMLAEDDTGGSGIGNKLIKAFTMQLDGRLEVSETDTKYRFKVTFPIEAGMPEP